MAPRSLGRDSVILLGHGCTTRPVAARLADGIGWRPTTQEERERKDSK
jgi:hypothetical protein